MTSVAVKSPRGPTPSSDTVKAGDGNLDSSFSRPRALINLWYLWRPPRDPASDNVGALGVTTLTVRRHFLAASPQIWLVSLCGYEKRWPGWFVVPSVVPCREILIMEKHQSRVWSLTHTFKQYIFSKPWKMCVSKAAGYESLFDRDKFFPSVAWARKTFTSDKYTELIISLLLGSFLF